MVVRCAEVQHSQRPRDWHLELGAVVLVVATGGAAEMPARLCGDACARHHMCTASLASCAVGDAFDARGMADTRDSSAI